ncbi:MAG: TetR/AcrR family transcriptional regulator [Ruminococcaceae bacterium]|nr:TetR/AcrR family transcriptional regulator [Oscillospiraceae bacterium]
MDNNKETKERLIESARAEFSEKGYTKASLRKICADAGVTTGALYFFFKDKEDLFAAIVEQPFNELKSLLLGHFTSEKEMSLSEMYAHIDGGHDELSAALIHHLYANYEAFMLLLTKSQGTRFERCVDEMVDMTDQTYRTMAESMARQLPNKQVNSYMLHWLSHMIIDAFIHLITHEPDESKAVEAMNRIMDFYVRSWIGLVLEDKVK